MNEKIMNIDPVFGSKVLDNGDVMFAWPPFLSNDNGVLSHLKVAGALSKKNYIIETRDSHPRIPRKGEHKVIKFVGVHDLTMIEYHAFEVLNIIWYNSAALVILQHEHLADFADFFQLAST